MLFEKRTENFLDLAFISDDIHLAIFFFFSSSVVVSLLLYNVTLTINSVKGGFVFSLYKVCIKVDMI